MMLLQIFAIIVVVFLSLLALKARTSWKICAICLAVSLTWVGLLLAYRIGWFGDGLLLGLLMGQSVAGVYYLLEKRVPGHWLLFRLPALLTLTYASYSVLTLTIQLWALLFIVFLWVSGLVLLAYQSKPRMRQFAKKLIACCGDW
jgi:hypothetical protein